MLRAGAWRERFEAIYLLEALGTAGNGFSEDVVTFLDAALPMARRDARESNFLTGADGAAKAVLGSATPFTQLFSDAASRAFVQEYLVGSALELLGNYPRGNEYLARVRESAVKHGCGEYYDLLSAAIAAGKS